MKKESLMDKFVKKDYNNELELVLEQKNLKKMCKVCSLVYYIKLRLHIKIMKQ